MWAQVQRTAANACVCAALIVSSTPVAAGAAEIQIPAAHVTTLDNHALNLPQDLPARATVLIIGFGRHSQDATTAWEKPVRLQLAHVPAIGFYDMAMLAEVPGFARPLVMRSVRKAVPDVLKPNFVPLVDHEDEWKQAAGYDAHSADSAYVLLVDAHGVIRWSTHEGYTPGGWQRLAEAARNLAGS